MQTRLTALDLAKVHHICKLLLEQYTKQEANLESDNQEQCVENHERSMESPPEIAAESEIDKGLTEVRELPIQSSSDITSRAC